MVHRFLCVIGVFSQYMVFFKLFGRNLVNNSKSAKDHSFLENPKTSFTGIISSRIHYSFVVSRALKPITFSCFLIWCTTSFSFSSSQNGETYRKHGKQTMILLFTDFFPLYLISLIALQDELNKELAEAGSKLVVIDFYATW